MKVQLSDGPARRGVPALGQGTWRMGENKNSHVDELGALRLGIDLGMTLKMTRSKTTFLML